MTRPDICYRPGNCECLDLLDDTHVCIYHHSNRPQSNPSKGLENEAAAYRGDTHITGYGMGGIVGAQMQVPGVVMAGPGTLSVKREGEKAWHKIGDITVFSVTPEPLPSVRITMGDVHTKDDLTPEDYVTMQMLLISASYCTDKFNVDSDQYQRIMSWLERRIESSVKASHSKSSVEETDTSRKNNNEDTTS